MPTKGRRIAAIDVGTNSIHMIVVEARRHGYRVIDREKEMVQLGRGSLEGKPLTDEAIDRGVASLKRMADIARRWEADDIVAVATSAIREASNRRRFIGAVQKATGIKVRAISGDEEADYIYRAVRSAVDFHGGTALIIDIGGGSLELIVGTDQEVYFTESEPLGALRVTQLFGLERAAGADVLGDCRRYVRKKMKKSMSRIRGIGFDFTIGTSGTIEALATISAETGSSPNGVVSGMKWLSRSRLEAIVEELAALDAEQRAARFAIDARRAETILAGAIVLLELLGKLHTERLRACEAALREGIVERLLAGSRNGKSAGSIRKASVRDLAKRSAVDRAHAAHVTRLSLRIFDQLEPLHLLKTGERELLEHAAQLHEIGMQVAYQGYHRHSYYMISHAGLRGFTTDQVAVMANTARYHRKSGPEADHPNFASLTAAQQKTVRVLSSILRLADALDRGRKGAVRDVGVRIDEQEIHLAPRLRAEASLEMESARRRARHLAQAFERRVTFAKAGDE